MGSWEGYRSGGGGGGSGRKMREEASALVLAARRRLRSRRACDARLQCQLARRAGWRALVICSSGGWVLCALVASQATERLICAFAGCVRA